jgi:ribosome production factor 1
LQEIGPRFTLKLRWLRKGLPAVTAADGSVPRSGDVQGDEVDDEEMARQEQADEDEAMAEMGKGVKAPSRKDGGDADLGIPPLDEEQEYEWKWKVSFYACSPCDQCLSRGILVRDQSGS